ncbi:MAG: hypothetical protein ACYDCN_10370 [Bacteroidia bacterium]
MMSKDVRIQQAIDNWDEYVAYLTTLPDKKLVQRLEIINMQAQLAYKQNIESSSELLEIWWRQTVEARILKDEHNIPDAPDEIELAVRDMETIVVKSEERQDTFTQPTHEKLHKQKIKKVDDSQMSLFSPIA